MSAIILIRIDHTSTVGDTRCNFVDKTIYYVRTFRTYTAVGGAVCGGARVWRGGRARAPARGTKTTPASRTVGILLIGAEDLVWKRRNNIVSNVHKV